MAFAPRKVIGFVWIWTAAACGPSGRGDPTEPEPGDAAEEPGDSGEEPGDAAVPVEFEGKVPPNEHLSCSPAPSPGQAAVVQGETAHCPDYVEDRRVKDLLVHSPAVGDSLWVRLFLPPNYGTAKRTWPVLYLLTGRGASYQSWSCNTFAEQYLAQTDVIVVMPDGSRSYDPCSPPDAIGDSALPSLYSDWESPSAGGAPEHWETFHLVELPQLLREHYKANGEFAIAGLSMGGAGALTYAARHPGMFAAAASYSGALNWISEVGQLVHSTILTSAAQDPNAPWGPFPTGAGAEQDGSHWAEHNPTSLASALLDLPLFIAVGDGSITDLAPDADAISSFVETGARSMADEFLSALQSANHGEPPPLVEREYYRGTHAWPYWDAELCRSLPMLMSALDVPYSETLPCNVPER